MGTVSEMATGFPGQTSVLPNSVAPLAKILRFNGYSTAMFGKSHEYVPWESGLTGPFDQWPTGLGFEKFYGNVIGESDQYSPSVHDNTTLVPPSKDPNYYYQTDLADRAIQWIKAQKTLNPDKPFFVYYPAQGMPTRFSFPRRGGTSTRASSTRDGTSIATRSWRARRSSGSSRPTRSSPPSPTSCRTGTR